jgi:tRNA nucleotidyltransferase (CCA-adding enzyme)
MKSAKRLVTCLSAIDFDALGAMLAITKLYPGALPANQSGLEQQVKQFISIYRDFISLQELHTIDKASVEELYIVDTRPSKKLDDFIKSFPNIKTCVVFDHHSGGSSKDKTRLVQKEVGSTTTMLVPLVRLRKIYISPQEATVMLTGIYEDTANLISPTTTPKDLETAAYLLSLGANLQVVRRFLQTALDDRGKEMLKLFLDNIEVVPMGGILVAISCVAYKNYVENLAFITHKLFDLVEADAIFTASSFEGVTYFVGRSLDERLVDSAKILSHFGGGGHKTAAAAKIKGELEPNIAYMRLLKVCQEEIIPPPTVSTIMSRPVKTIDPHMPVRQAKHILERYGHGGLPVVNNNKLIGIITRRDLDKAQSAFSDAPIKRFMTTDVLTIEASASIVEARRLMMKGSVGRLPVLSEGKLVGIVTRSDVLKAAFWHRGQDIGPFPPPTRFDSMQTRELFARIKPRFREYIELVRAGAKEMEVNLYLVGGAVRDMVMNRTFTDLDFLVEGDAIHLASIIHERLGGKLIRYERFGTARVVTDLMQIDIATARAEYYTEPGVHPKVQQSSIKEDLLRRDFTVNALALALTGEDADHIIDYTGGLDDIANKRLRILHNLSFVEDPTRILRAIYYAYLLGLEIESETLRLAKDAIKTGLLSTAKNERTAQELEKILANPEGCEMLVGLEKLKGLTSMFAKVPNHLSLKLKKIDRLIATGAEFGFHADFWTTRLLVLIEENDTNLAKEILGHLKLAPKLIESVCNAKDSAKRLFETYLEKDGVKLFKTIRNMADPAIVMAVSMMRSHDSLKAFDEMARIKAIKLSISGDDLIREGVKPGKALGSVLEAVLLEKVAGRIWGQKDELDMARRLLVG